MNLRDQLLKSGLASKEQAKKAQREVSKKQHQKIQEARAPEAKTELSLGEETLLAQREADRVLNAQRNQERAQREAEARINDIITSHDLLDRYGSEPYYFVIEGKRITKIGVHDEQIAMLEKGELAIISRNIENSFHLVSAENAEKIAAIYPHYIVCQYKA
ncbi:MAG: DUF2058 family protein [Chitinophagaceae bacterium]|nr:DUF2058 family protein [Oligoflexus sp.]